jgi:hypothetical protein
MAMQIGMAKAQLVRHPAITPADKAQQRQHRGAV